MNKLLLLGALLGLCSVVMGALGDHAFNLTPENTESLETAIRYNMLYAVLIIAIACAPQEQKLHISGFIFSLGTALFSFSIYSAIISGFEALTYITPLGGLIIMVAWGSLIIKALKSNSVSKNNS